MQLVNCGLSDVTIQALEQRGITALFPIQKHVYEPAAAGRVQYGTLGHGTVRCGYPVSLHWVLCPDQA